MHKGNYFLQIKKIHNFNYNGFETASLFIEISFPFRVILPILIICMPVIALDLGGTKLAAALLSDKGEIINREVTKLKKSKGLKSVNSFCNRHIFLTKAKEKNIKVDALGICVPGIAHAKTGTVWAPNIPGWDDYPLLDELKSGLADHNIKIRMDSDRACYILGEVWKGNAAGHSDVIFFRWVQGLARVLLPITRCCAALMILPVLSDGWD